MSSKLPTLETAVIDETQNEVLSQLPVEGHRLNLPNWIGSLKIVAETPEETVKTVLGNTGVRLHRFALRVNLDHPDLESYFSSIGKSVIDMYKSSADILVAAAQDITQKKELASVEKDFLANEDWMKALRLIDMPRARLLASLNDRNKQRDIKKQVKPVGLKSVFTGGENSFFGRPEHFRRFVRGSKYYLEEMKAFQVRQELFTSKNMNDMAHTYAKRMRSLEESVSEDLGFYRIKPDEAAVTLARLHDFKWNDVGIVNVSSKHFDGCHFWSEGAQPKVEDKTESLKKALILNTQFVPTSIGSVLFTYQPRMYPLSLWNAKVPSPERVQKIIDRSERFSSLNQTPFFDYYWVLVPGINISHPLIQKTKDHYTIREDGENVIYNDLTAASFAVDSILAKAGYIVPIIIGERDGKCYFLSMWV